jgi:hypothetical protein
MLSKTFLTLAFVMLGGSGPDRYSSPERLVLCDQPPHSGSQIILDYRTKWGLNEDVAVPVELCAGRGACISWPFVFSAPPSFPRTASDEVRWSMGGHNFLMGREADGRTYWIVAHPAPIEANGRSWSRDAIRYRYSATEGIIELRRLIDDHRWQRCEGRLKFDDLARMRADSNPAARRPPQFGVH